MTRTNRRRNSSSRHPLRSRLGLERLEQREVPSVAAIGGEFRLNGFTTGFQQAVQVAADADGDFVAVWQSASQDGDQDGIFGRRYSASGTALANEFQVNTFTTGQQGGAAVAMDGDGDFIAVWTSVGQDGDVGGVFAQRYAANGTPLGTEFRVNSITTGSQNGQKVAMDVDGDFVVVWNSNHLGNSEVFARRYSADGTPLGAEFRVNSTTTGEQSIPAVAMSATGQFVVAWHSLESGANGQNVFGQRFDATGAPQGAEFQINTFTTDDQRFPSVGMDADGDFVAAWESVGQDGAVEGVYWQRFDKLGVPQGSETRANVVTADDQGIPRVSVDADGDFAIVWTSNLQDGNSYGSYARLYDPAGVAKGTEFRLNTSTVGAQRFAAVSSDAEGDLVAIWEGPGTGDTFGIYGQRFEESVDNTAPWATGVFVGGQTDPIRLGERLVGSVPSLVVAFSEDMATTGTQAITNPAHWRLQRDNVDISNQIGAMTYGFNAATRRFEVQVPLTAPLTAGVYDLLIRSSTTDPNGNRLDGNFDGIETGQWTHRFRVVPPAPGITELAANLTTNNDQRGADVAADANGNTIVVWQSLNQDGNSWGIYLRRFDNTGAALIGEFPVNTTTSLAQTDPAVARDADGDFVVVWTNQDNAAGATSVRGRRYLANGVAQGSEFIVAAGGGDTHSMPDVAMDADGNFVVAWKATFIEGQPSGIYFQRYSADGTAVGGNTRASVATTAGLNHAEPTVAMSATGEYFIAWQTSGQDSSGLGVYGRLYTASALPLISEFRVNPNTGGDQDQPAAAMDADGDFVVAWRQEGGTEVGSSVRARRFASDATALGTEFFVDSLAFTDNHLAPSVAMDADGDFVVAFVFEGGDGSADGIFARRFDRTGVAQGVEFPVNIFTSGSQADPSVTMDADGDFVVFWQSPQDGSSNGIYGRRYGAPARITSVRVNDGNVQRSRVTSLTITFDSIVQFATTPGAAFTLTRNGAGAVTFNATASNATGVTVLTLDAFTGNETQIGSLRDGRYTLTGFANQISAGTVQLDGDGNGTTGDNFTFGDPQGLFRFYGDVNGDRRVDISDFGFFSLAYLTPANYNAALDFNNDGRIDIADFGQFSLRYFTNLP